MRTANLGLKFLLELCAIGLLAAGGFRSGDGALALVLGIGAPLAMVLVWGRYAAPRAPRRLPSRGRIPLELAIFAAAGALAFGAGLRVVAVAFLVAVVVNAGALSAFGQWEA
ncbi:MAG TPA: YrdB family protein [Nocardioides sp.]|nr:YrdB family protein [Nocardioides sp.]